MPRAADRLERWTAAVATSGATDDDVLEQVRAHLDDDLDTAAAVTAIDRAAGEGRDIAAAAALLGVDLGA
jgi:hypothetical protein